MKTVMIILFAFALGSFANAQMVRKNIPGVKAVSFAEISNKKICNKPDQNRKRLHLKTSPAKLNHADIKTIPADRKIK